MNPFRSSPRRRPRTQFGPEALETRSLLTGGAGNTFAIIPGTITTPGQTVDVTFTIDSSHFKLPHGKMALGVDVAAASDASTLLPFISSVTDPHGNLIPQTFHSMYNPHLTHPQVAALGPKAASVITPIGFYPHNSSQPATYTVQITGEGSGTGQFYVGFYLPGDAQGDGTVDQQDIKIIKSLQGTTSSSSNYDFNADVNRDGRIGPIDLAYVLQNQGVSVNVSPVVVANLDPNSVTSPTTRSTTNPSAVFTGTATPGATITYANQNADLPPVTTTADSAGNYSLLVALDPGSNTFNVTSVDEFGQTITGSVAPVIYTPVPAP
jgi:hypothetical protein